MKKKFRKIKKALSSKFKINYTNQIELKKISILSDFSLKITRND